MHYDFETGLTNTVLAISANLFVLKYRQRKVSGITVSFVK